MFNNRTKREHQARREEFWATVYANTLSEINKMSMYPAERLSLTKSRADEALAAFDEKFKMEGETKKIKK